MVRRNALEHVRALQAESLGYLLVRAGQLFSERAVALVNAEAGGPVVREAHTRLFPHLLAEGGIRITELAKSLGVTKQAVQPLVAELTELGIVRLEADPLDARARRVLLTDHGIAAMVHGTGVLLRVEAQVAAQLSSRDVAQLKRALARLLPLLERASPGLPSSTGTVGRATSSRARRAPGTRA